METDDRHANAERGHDLTRLSVSDKRSFERHAVGIACRLSYFRTGIRKVRTLFAVTIDLSRGGALLQLHEPCPELEYFNIEFAPADRPVGAVARRTNATEVGCEFLEPLSAERLIEVLSRARS